MLRFLSRRKVRHNYAEGGGNTNESGIALTSQIKPQRIVVNKNKIDCRVILLDGTDLSIELNVSFYLLYECIYLYYIYHTYITIAEKVLRFILV